MADTPLFAFRSTTGRYFLSTEKPGPDFVIAGEVEDVGELDVLDERMAIPGTNWNDPKPTVLFRSLERNVAGKHDYRIGWPSHETPDGFERLGSEFAFVIDDWNFRRAVALDAGKPFDEKPH